MKRFLISILYVILFFCVFAACWSIIFTQWELYAYTIKKEHPYCRINFVTNYVQENPDLVILGNSRAEDSYSDSILSARLHLKCINLGWSGYPFDYQYNVMWKTYLKNNSFPKYVILEIGPWAFLDYVNPIYIAELLPYINRPEFQFYYELCPELSWADKLSMTYKYRGKIKKIYEDYEKTINKEKTPNNSSKKWNANYLGKPQKLEQDPEILSLLDTFIEECRQNDIKLVCVCSPIHIKDGASYFDMGSFWKLIYQHTNNKGIHVLNYQNEYGNDTTKFANPMHLNEAGKYSFSQKIAHDLDSLGIISH